MGQLGQVLTANRLRDGEVVYWTGSGWAGGLSQAAIFGDPKKAQEALLAAEDFVRERIVVNPYLFGVGRAGAELRPVKERELIRAAGPSVRRDLGKQALDVSL